MNRHINPIPSKPVMLIMLQPRSSGNCLPWLSPLACHTCHTYQVLRFVLTHTKLDIPFNSLIYNGVYIYHYYYDYYCLLLLIIYYYYCILLYEKKHLCSSNPQKYARCRFQLRPHPGTPTATTSGPRPAPTTMASVVATAQSWGFNQQKCALDQQKWIEMGVQPAKTFKFNQQKIGFEE